MARWEKIVKAHYKRAHARDGYQFAANAGATAAHIAAFQEQCGVHFPDEFIELYSIMNGFGVKSASEPEKIYWFARPLGELPQFADTIRNWFRETHPDPARRFFPFIDWGNGDGLGYLANADGQIRPGLYCFEHESYRFRAEQDAAEFFSHAPITLEKFLNSV